ncbi:14635_t:CDS:2 [Cetraspora pellucida]|uniref:14635_t:CDS:1 n=1 Tax=Cetraspora pellucida TaxID=1433469 RepID=A0ACA9MPC9_9GLOM|nr:14635_t:CDS:2 [Cetraspora pellucida]
MGFCTSCNNTLPVEAFVHKGKNYKTCSNCLDARSKKRNLKKRPLSNNNKYEKESERTYNNISFTQIAEYVTSKAANLGKNEMLFFNLHIELDNIILNTAQHNAKNIVRLIVDEIEGLDRYDWVFTTGAEMTIHFDCHKKLKICIDIPAKGAIVMFCHDIQYEKPIDVTTPLEVKQEIMQNLHMDPIQLRTHLHQKFNVLLTTNKRIHYWWSIYCQRLYKSDDDHIISASIGFTTPLFFQLLPLSSVHCDAIYKTARGCFELLEILKEQAFL